MILNHKAAGLALAGALLAASPTPAQQGEPIGSWWLLAMPGGAGALPRVAMERFEPEITHTP